MLKSQLNLCLFQQPLLLGAIQFMHQNKFLFLIQTGRVQLNLHAKLCTNQFLFGVKKQHVTQWSQSHIPILHPHQIINFATRLRYLFQASVFAKNNHRWRQFHKKTEKFHFCFKINSISVQLKLLLAIFQQKFLAQIQKLMISKFSKFQS